MVRFFSRALTILILLTACAAAQDLPSADEVMQKLIDANDQLKSFTADFRQTETDEFGDQTVISGTAAFLKPGRYLLVSVLKGKPHEEVGMNETHAWRIRHHLKTIEKVLVKESDKVSDGLDIRSPEDLQANFDLTVKDIENLASGPAYHLVGKPKKSGSKYQSIEIWVNNEIPSPIVKVRTAQKRIVTVFEFTTIKRDVSIDPSRFVYKVPSGYTEHLQ